MSNRYFWLAAFAACLAMPRPCLAQPAMPRPEPVPKTTEPPALPLPPMYAPTYSPPIYSPLPVVPPSAGGGMDYGSQQYVPTDGPSPQAAAPHAYVPKHPKFRQWLANHRREPDGVPTPVGNGNAYTEFKFVVGSSRQFFGTAESSQGVWHGAYIPPPPYR